MMSEKPIRAPKEVSFQEDTGFLVVKIDKDDYGYDQRVVILDGRSLSPKDELHITILSRDAADQVTEYLQQNPKDAPGVKKLIDQTYWSFYKENRFYHVREDEETETIIQMVEVPELEPFFKKLGEMTGRSLDLPPVHVTLYMRGTEKGIGLPTQAVFDELVQEKVDLDELERAD
jgi:hypothetical protein